MRNLGDCEKHYECEYRTPKNETSFFRFNTGEVVYVNDNAQPFEDIILKSSVILKRKLNKKLKKLKHYEKENRICK